ncbi:MAG: DUF4097 domain-containing protein [Lachnospiraceae bacterium]|nr:DUF4097 domain-containing protein [Lachnospiraceae bacterium]
MKNNTSKLIITILTITTIIAIILGMYIHVYRGFGGFFFGGSKESVSDTLTFEGSVSALDLNADFANVTILPGDGPLTVSYTMPKEMIPDITFGNGKLIITPKKGVFITHFNWNTEYSITVTVPAGTDLTSLKLDSDAGNISVRDVNAATVSIEVDAGNVNISNLTADAFLINSDAGNLLLDKVAATEMTLETDAGNIDLNASNVQTFNVDLDAGNLEIISSVIDTINADTDMGNIESRDAEIHSGTCTTDMGDIDLQGNIGDVKVKTSLGKVR